MILIIIYLLHVILCVTESVVKVLSGILLILLGIRNINHEYFMRLLDIRIYFICLIIGLFYIIFMLKIMKFGSIGHILKIIIKYKSNFIDINYPLIIYEEYVFRVILSYIFEVSFLSFVPLIFYILIMGFVFTIVHKFESKIQTYEFLLFSILLSSCFVYTHSLFLVSLIHILRNYSIKSIAKYIETTGDINANN